MTAPDRAKHVDRGVPGTPSPTGEVRGVVAQAGEVRGVLAVQAGEVRGVPGTPSPETSSTPDLLARAVRIIGRVACGDLAGVSVADLAVLADIACRLARSPSPMVTYVESVAVSALAHAPTQPDRDALARCLQTQKGRGEVAHALADARRRIARGD